MKKLPSDHLRQNIRFGSQPLPNTPLARRPQTFLKWMRADETLLFAVYKDYPHWDWDEPAGFWLALNVNSGKSNGGECAGSFAKCGLPEELELMLRQQRL